MRIWMKLPRKGLPEGDIYFDGNSFRQMNQGKIKPCKCIDLASAGTIHSEPPSGKHKIYNMWINAQGNLECERENVPEP